MRVESTRYVENMAEGVGFEPTKVSLAGFQDRCTRPLCEPSVGKLTLSIRTLKIECEGRAIKQVVRAALR